MHKLAFPKNFSVRKCVFFVRDIVSRADYFTQYFKPDVRPLKVFFNGFDVTHYLTYKTSLTNFSYHFLSVDGCTFGFTTTDIRAFFRVQRKSKTLLVRQQLTSKRRGVVSFQSGGVLVPIQSKSTADGKPSVKVQVPLDAVKSVLPGTGAKKRSISEVGAGSDLGSTSSVSPAGVNLFGKKLKIGGLPVDAITYQQSKFGKASVLSDALRLAVLQVVPDLKCMNSSFELRLRMIEDGFGDDVLVQLQTYLAAKLPSLLTYDGKMRLVNHYVSFYGRRVRNEMCFCPPDRLTLSNMFRVLPTI